MRRDLMAAAVSLALVAGGAGTAGAAPPADGHSAAAATGESRDGSIFSPDRVALSEQQERAIWRAAESMPVQDLPQVTVAPGVRLPPSVALADMPAEVTAGDGGSLAAYRLARVEAGVAIVDPADHTVLAVVTLQEGTGLALAPSGHPVRTLPQIDAETVFNATPIERQVPQTLGAGSGDP